MTAHLDGWAVILPGYGPNRVMVEGAFSDSFQAGWELLLSFLSAAALVGIVTMVLRRAVGHRD